MIDGYKDFSQIQDFPINKYQEPKDFSMFKTGKIKYKNK